MNITTIGRWWRWALRSPDAVAPSRMVSVSASVNLPLHHKVQKFSSGTVSPGWSWKKGRKTVVVWCGVVVQRREVGLCCFKRTRTSTAGRQLPHRVSLGTRNREEVDCTSQHRARPVFTLSFRFLHPRSRAAVIVVV